MDIWQRERSLARVTVWWGAASVAAGLLLALRRDPWWRGFGLQSAGWGAVDVGIALLAERLQDRRMRRRPDPYAPAALEAERVAVRRVLVVNAVADAGYVVLGSVLARSARPRVAGAGAAVAVQGLFLLLHDSHHAWYARPQPVSAAAGHDGSGGGRPAGRARAAGTAGTRAVPGPDRSASAG